MTSTLETQAREEQREAARVLLRQPVIGPEDPAFRLVRRHERALHRRFDDLLGYRLDCSATLARLVKRPTEASLRRPVRVRPGTPTGRARARDEWPALDRRRAVLLALCLAALEREGQQTIVGELARRIAEAGARCEPAIVVDFDLRGERLALADVLDLLCEWGVLTLTSGSRSSFARAAPAEDEALLTIERRRLASLLVDPFDLMAAGGLGDLLDDTDAYAPTAEGANRRMRHRLARRLVEDPVLYASGLDDGELAYFHRQRAYLEGEVSELTGLQAERRAEGTAMVERGRELTDVAFPAASTVKQVALLLCERLSDAIGTPLTLEAVRDDVRALIAAHGAAWSRSAQDPAHVEQLLESALGVLAGLDLVQRCGETVTPLPLCARFRSPAISSREVAA